ncbi:SUMO-activating enzyme subunit 1 [Fukomys damarensis]|uniref:SUMO-activating enzyme subunit 1 n=1 Tax=Fukomys damarensis TaxID=885580 RepID=A0A091D733_FUKDA|nr:SUMO-activating enzyme subunit 1 [Fukomys damarensis]
MNRYPGALGMQNPAVDMRKLPGKLQTQDFFSITGTEEVLLKFRTDKGRDPNSDTYAEDSELLLHIRNDVLDSLGVTPDLLPDDFVSSDVWRCGNLLPNNRLPPRLLAWREGLPDLRMATSRNEPVAAIGVGAYGTGYEAHESPLEEELEEAYPSTRYCFSEMAPVCAVVGGILAQEIVKALSQRDPPHNNFFFFDGMKGNGTVECLGPK